MTVLTRWEPVRELANLHERMNRLFNDSFSPVTTRSRSRLARLSRLLMSMRMSRGFD